MKTLPSTQLIPRAGGSICLAQGQCWQHGGTAFQIVECQGGWTTLEAIGTGQRKIVGDGALLEEILSGRAQPLDPRESLNKRVAAAGVLDPSLVASLSDAAALRFVSLSTWLCELRGKSLFPLSDRLEVRAELQRLYAAPDKAGLEQFEISTLIAAQRALDKSHGDQMSLIPLFSRRGGRGRSRLAPVIEETIARVFNEVAQSTGRVVKQQVIERTLVECQLACSAMGIPTVKTTSESTIARRFDQRFSKYDMAVRNYGKKRADRKFRENGPRPRAQYPLDILEYDDTDTQVYLLDRRTGLPCGRGHLTIGVDQSTCVPMGMSLDFSSRSNRSAIDAVLNGLLPKDGSVPMFKDMPADWVGYGVPGIILMDNALYNQSNETLRALLNIESVLGWAKPYQPTEKCSIEHLNSRIKQEFCPSLPGWSGDSEDRGGHRRGAEQAVMFLDEFQRCFVHWVVAEYSNQPLEDGLSPRQRWARFFSSVGPTVRWSREQLQLMRMEPRNATFRASGGLLILGLRYGSDDLTDLRRHLGATARVVVLIHPDALDFVLVKHPHTGALIRAKCLEDAKYLEGMTVRLQRLVLKYARRKGMRNPSWPQVVAARRELALATEELARDRRLRRRQRAARDALPETDAGVRTESFEGIVTSPREVQVCDLEQSIYELDAVLLSEEGWS